MTNQRRLATSRLAGILSILAAFSILLLGWWMIAVALTFGIASRLLVPRPEPHGDRRRIHRALEAAYMRLHPHAWRPGRR